MGRTLSARWRRSFARTTAQQRTGAAGRIDASQNLAAPMLMIAGLVQCALLIGLTASQTWLPPSHLQQAMPALMVLAIVSSSYVAFFAITRTRSVNNAGADVAFSRLPAYPFEPLIKHGVRDDANELAHLRARVAHELRTPLNAVIGLSEMMHREVLGPVGHERYREYAAHIRESAEYFQSAAEKTLAVNELLTSQTSGARSVVALGEAVAASRQDPAVKSGERTVAIEIQSGTLVEVNHAALDNALHHLWQVAAAFERLAALSGTTPDGARLRISCTGVSAGFADMVIDVTGVDAGVLAADSERVPGVELSLMLGRLGIETAGGALLVDTSDVSRWRMIVRLPGAMQAELPLH